MLDVSELIQDDDFQQTFVVTRTTGTWVNGRFTNDTPTALILQGIIDPVSSREMVQLPEGDSITGAINIYTLVPLYTTTLNQSTGNTGNISDEVTWRNQSWKIIQTFDYIDYGYFKATATRKLGA